MATPTPATNAVAVRANPSPSSLPPNFSHTDPPPQLIAQGAEALLYRTHFLLPSIPCALKYRPSKPYRHPILDARLTRHRILAEARVLVKCRREGVHVPGVLALDWEVGWLIMEWVEGRTIRGCFDEFLGGDSEEAVQGSKEGDKRHAELMDLMGRVGTAVGRMHDVGVVHGDLTTSNLMLRPYTMAPISSSTDSDLHLSETEDLEHGRRLHEEDVAALRGLQGEVVMIDFGLGAFSTSDEDRAVDLYVLERAFISTHPRAEALFQEILRTYGGSYKGARIALKRLEDVRQRGRKKSMIG